MADEMNHINKNKFKVPFVCGCRDLGEALVSPFLTYLTYLPTYLPTVPQCGGKDQGIVVANMSTPLRP